MSISSKDVHSRAVQTLYASKGSSFSSRNGNSVIRLQIAEQARVMKDLRFCGKFKLLTGDGELPDTTNDLVYNNWSGLHSAIQSIEVQSLRTGQLIEQIQNYARRNAHKMSAVTSPLRLNMDMQNEHICGSLYDICKVQAEIDGSFSLRLDIGCLQSSLGYTIGEVGGLTVTINLNPSPQFCFDQAGTNGPCYFELNDVFFSATMLNPKPEWLIARAGQGAHTISFPTTVSRPNQLQSNSEQLYDISNFSRLSSSAILASNLNNYLAGSFGLEVIGITETSLSINGRSFPVLFPLKGASC